MKARSGRLLPHQKAGRVIRLMAWLAVVATVGIGAAVLLPALSARGALPLELLIMLAFIAAFAVGLFFVAGAVMRHKTWGRVAGIVYGLLSLAGFPIGTIIGLYILRHLVLGWNEVEANA
jgi:MFS family permease